MDILILDVRTLVWHNLTRSKTRNSNTACCKKITRKRSARCHVASCLLQLARLGKHRRLIIIYLCIAQVRPLITLAAHACDADVCHSPQRCSLQHAHPNATTHAQHSDLSGRGRSAVLHPASKQVFRHTYVFNRTSSSVAVNNMSCLPGFIACQIPTLWVSFSASLPHNHKVHKAS